MKILLFVAIGGFLGSISRFSLTRYVQKRYNKSFPLATFIINLTGSGLLGVLFSQQQMSGLYLFLGTGFMGAYTTFSTFELETVELVRKKKAYIGLAYVVLSTALGLSFAYLGYLLGKSF